METFPDIYSVMPDGVAVLSLFLWCCVIAMVGIVCIVVLRFLYGAVEY